MNKIVLSLVAITSISFAADSFYFKIADDVCFKGDTESVYSLMAENKTMIVNEFSEPEDHYGQLKIEGERKTLQLFDDVEKEFYKIHYYTNDRCEG